MNIPIQAGQRFGPYELRELVGEGGMAQVWKAWNEGLTRFEALKFPLLSAASPGNEETFIARFLGEARVAANLSHPHIATIYSVSSDATHPYFAMQFITGVGLDALIAQSGRISPRDALAILEPVAAALDYAHELGVVHRDIKPANILLQSRSAGWHPFVLDFGIARALQEDGTQAPRLTRSGAIIGTPEYMSPEQIKSLPATKAGDLYSLGIVAYEMLCGRPPFQVPSGGSTVSVLMQHVQEPPPPPNPICSDISPALAKALLWALQKNPASRPSSCRQWVEAMQHAVGPVTRVKSSLAKPVWIIPVAVVGVLCAFGVGYSAFRPFDSEASVSPSPLSVSTSAVAPTPLSDHTTINNQNTDNNHRTIIIVATATPSPSRELLLNTSPTPDARMVQSRMLAKQAGEKVDTSTATLQDLMSRPKDQPITDADKDSYKKQIVSLKSAYSLANRAVALDQNNEEGWVQLCRATIYLDKCGEDNFVQKVAARFPSSSRFKPLMALAKSNAKDGCYQ